MGYVVYQITCICRQGYQMSHIYVAKVTNLRNTGISWIILNSPQATLTTAFWNHEVTKWCLRTEATHGHAGLEVQVSLQVSKITMYSIFWYLLGLSRSTTHVASITWKLTSMSTVMIYPNSMWRQVISLKSVMRFRRSVMRSGNIEKNVYIHIYIYANTHTRRRKRTLTHTQIYIHTYIHIHIYT